MYSNIIKKKVKKYCEDNSISNNDIGFLKFINELFYSDNHSEIDDSIVDGQSDKQIDLIQIEEDNTTTIRIMQVKNTKGFESNIVILLRNGLDWIFKREEEEILQLKNISFRDRILEVRDILDRESKRNIYVDICYVTLGNKKDIVDTDEINAEIKKINDEYSLLFENFRFELYGAKEISDYIDSLYDKSVNAKVKIIYDTNVKSLIEVQHEKIRSIVCNIEAKELIKIFEAPQSEYLFEQNVRKYLDDKGKVNSNIIDTASGSDSQYFWALNNGVTIICDKCDLKAIGGKASLDMKNIQIINGCQTTMALFQAYKNNNLKDNTSLLLRVHETDDLNVIEKIILSTNNQNPINPRDLISNSVKQIEIQKYFFEMYGLTYQRKRNDFNDINGKLVSKKEIITNDKVGQAALACIKHMPNRALASKGKVFTEDNDIFDKNKERISLAYFIFEKVIEYSKCDDIKKQGQMASILKFGRFHIASILYNKYVNNASVEFNKKLKHNDVDITRDIFLLTYLLDEEISNEQKGNLLAYFKTKESVKNIELVEKAFIKINNIIRLIVDKYDINDFNIVNFIEEDMTFYIESTEIKIKTSGKINIYSRVISEDVPYIDNEDEYKQFCEEKEAIIGLLTDKFKETPEEIDDSCVGCLDVESLIGYFNRDFDPNFIKEFVNAII